jgi:hypothetical protein
MLYLPGMRSFPDIWALEQAARTPEEDLTLRRSQAFGNGWGTHLPLLASVVAIARPGHVLELGSGFFSTTLLAEMCHVMGRELTVYDSDADWRQRAIDGLRGVYASTNEIYWEDLQYPWSVIFIDNHPDESRLWNLQRARNGKSEFVVMHDTCNPYFKGVDEELDKFKYRYDYVQMSSCTTVVSNVREYPK